MDNHLEPKIFSLDPNDEGTVWFSESGAEEKILEYLQQKADEGVFAQNDEDSTTVGTPPITFLDLGTGNGHMLFALRDEGWDGAMLGVDYSAESVRLAESINRRLRDQSRDTLRERYFRDVNFKQYDIFSGEKLVAPPELYREVGNPPKFDVVLDKGTFDAISLSAETDSSGRRIFESYPSCVKPLVKHGGLFIITSCNWTEEEIKGWFEGKGNADDDAELARLGVFRLKGCLKYPSFSFGGKTGQSVGTLVFTKENYEPLLRPPSERTQEETSVVIDSGANPETPVPEPRLVVQPHSPPVDPALT